LNGVINIDKPAGMTSHDVVYRVRKLAGQKRVGHAGTLDPDATGLLLVCLGYATRLSDLLADQGKSYEAVLRLGQTTSTEDSSGTVLTEADPSGVTESDLLALLPRFTGAIEQIPPMVSAVHHNGQRLYDLARQGITVEREARTIEIESIELLSFSPGAECSAALRVCCGKGTYIRTLCADIGAALGVGGHMALLRRTSVSVFNASDAVPLDALTKENFPKWVTSSSDAVAFLPSTELDDQQLADVLNGKKFECLLTFEQDQLVRLLRGDELLGLGRYADGFLQPEKVFPPVEE
jgi:tRNA pseudouridine55 synthase